MLLLTNHCNYRWQIILGDLNRYHFYLELIYIHVLLIASAANWLFSTLLWRNTIERENMSKFKFKMLFLKNDEKYKNTNVRFISNICNKLVKK